MHRDSKLELHRCRLDLRIDCEASAKQGQALVLSLVHLFSCLGQSANLGKQLVHEDVNLTPATSYGKKLLQSIVDTSLLSEVKCAFGGTPHIHRQHMATISPGRSDTCDVDSSHVEGTHISTKREVCASKSSLCFQSSWVTYAASDHDAQSETQQSASRACQHAHGTLHELTPLWQQECCVRASPVLADVPSRLPQPVVHWQSESCTQECSDMAVTRLGLLLMRLLMRWSKPCSTGIQTDRQNNPALSCKTLLVLLIPVETMRASLHVERGMGRGRGLLHETSQIYLKHLTWSVRRHDFSVDSLSMFPFSLYVCNTVQH